MLLGTRDKPPKIKGMEISFQGYPISSDQNLHATFYLKINI